MNCRGYTIIEIVVVIAITGLLSVLAIPDMSAFAGRLRLETTARGLSTDLREMKIRAALDRAPFTIYFDVLNNSYEIPGRRVFLPEGTRFGYGPGVLGPPANPVHVPDADGVSFSSNQATFYPGGSNSMGTIYLTNENDITMALSVSITGRTRIWRWDGEGWT